MEIGEGGISQGTERRQTKGEPAEEDARAGGRGTRPLPTLQLLAFYLILIGIAVALYWYVPAVPQALKVTALQETAASGNFLQGETSIAPRPPGETVPFRMLGVLIVTLGALAISLPVAWVYTYTRRLRYDPSLVHSVIILPMVVAGIVLVIRDNIALAFALFGIVAAVRFRNTLKDPKDAVYIFLALGIGLSAGVQALDIALVMSILFNAVVLVLWKWNLGAIYGGESQRDLFAIGDATLMIARSPSQRDAIRYRLTPESQEMKELDGILLVHSEDPDAARQRLELSLAKYADDWRLVEKFRRRNGVATLAALLRLDEKKGDPLALLAELDERWADDVAAAEYIPFRRAAQEESNVEA